MKVSAINSSTSTQKGKRIGTVAGLGVGGAYVAKSGKDVFESALKTLNSASQDVASKNKATAIAVGVCVAVIGGLTLAGRVIGSALGKMVDKHNEKKATKELISKVIQEEVNSGNVNAISINELEKLTKED